jgi:guanosine-3',5'-bis(diphosphate) 3'-pyrophosphohydrolase
MAGRSAQWTLNLERALRLAAAGHRDQVRKGTGVPYIEHPMAVALILDREGFDEEVVIAGLLHDLVEDTDVTLEQIRDGFGQSVGVIVGACSEVKLDAEGKKRPWIDRKRDHLAALLHASDEVFAVILADKLHNLISIKLDLIDGIPVWGTFNASKDQVLWYCRATIDACRSDDPRLLRLSDKCSAVLAEVTEL